MMNFDETWEIQQVLLADQIYLKGQKACAPPPTKIKSIWKDLKIFVKYCFVCFCITAPIHTRIEIQCLPYAGFLSSSLNIVTL